MAGPAAASTPPAMQDCRQNAPVDQSDAQNRGSMPGKGAQGRGRGGRHAASPSRGGRGGRFESRSQQPGRWGHSPLPPEPVLPDNARQFGVVVTVKETFGFIK